MKYFKNISLASLRKRLDSGRALANYLILNELPNAADGMETSKRRDCDEPKSSYYVAHFLPMEWRPQKEGIATRLTYFSSGFLWPTGWNGDLKKKGLRLRRALSGSSSIRGWNGDLKKKGLRLNLKALLIFYLLQMEWRPQKEGIATREPAVISPWPARMEWRPQKEGIATGHIVSHHDAEHGWNGDLKKKGLRL